MKISIVTPNYNGAKYLEDTILSVLGQNYPDLEYIIVDGGSTDGSVEIIKKYERQLSWWVSEPDNGLYDAIQKGFDHSSGEIMAWINSDDMYHKNALDCVADIFTNIPEVNWLLGATTYYDEKGRTVECNRSRSFDKFDFYNHDFKWIQQESVFWRRKLWNKVDSHINVNFKYAGDFDLWLRFFSNERLFLTHALIGGFRVRNSNQLSLDHMEEYLEEVHLSVSNIKLNEDERKILINYKRLLKTIPLLKWMKYLDADLIIKRYRSKYFSKPSFVVFDSIKNKFILRTK